MTTKKRLLVNLAILSVAGVIIVFFNWRMVSLTNQPAIKTTPTSSNANWCEIDQEHTDLVTAGEKTKSMSDSLFAKAIRDYGRARMRAAYETLRSGHSLVCHDGESGWRLISDLKRDIIAEAITYKIEGYDGEILRSAFIRDAKPRIQKVIAAMNGASSEENEGWQYLRELVVDARDLFGITPRELGITPDIEKKIW